MAKGQGPEGPRSHHQMSFKAQGAGHRAKSINGDTFHITDLNFSNAT